MLKIFITITLYIFLLGSLKANTSFYEEGVNLYKDKKFSKAKFKFEQDIVFNPKSEKSYLYLSKARMCTSYWGQLLISSAKCTRRFFNFSHSCKSLPSKSACSALQKFTKLSHCSYATLFKRLKHSTRSKGYLR